ncbi:MAG: HNH endonuclease signature motif containing protein [Candidatus Aminicenantes bacterium]|jgi:hypothetical protein
MGKKSINPSQQKLLWGKSASRCAICKEILHKPDKEGKDYPIGEMAHIEGENPGAARYNTNMTDEERNNYQNLILLCPTHHIIIDKDESEYTVRKLKQIKKDHEKWIQDSLRTQIADITFAELDVILKYLTVVDIPHGDKPITIIPPAKKIKKNDLSGEVGNLITIGMIQRKLIKNYLNKHPDLDFSVRLSRGFFDKYEELRQDGLIGDALFYELWDFASNYSDDFKQKTAGLSVLTYFFELCEVFEE